MRDTPLVMVKFVKIVERFPAIYDSTSDSYRTKIEWDAAWESIVECVRNEINEECTVDELRAKWKGIRSSFSRYKGKLYNSESKCKKYYLYDALKFLDPFTKPKVAPPHPGNQSSATYDESEYSDMHIEYSNVDSLAWEEEDSKTGIVQADDADSETHNIETTYDSDSFKTGPVKRRKRHSARNNIEMESEYFQFFQSIMRDVRNFTQKEKRQFKIGVLKLIDEIEDAREKDLTSSEAKSSKLNN